MATKRSPKSISKGRRRRFLASEIVLDILSRLPTRPLMRFQSASKLWFSLISQNLIQARALPSSLLGFFYHRGHTVGHSSGKTSPPFYRMDHHQLPEYDIDTSLSFLPTIQEHMTWKEIVDSSNGLLLVRNCSHLVCDTVYYVCNPAIKRWTVLPHLPPTGNTVRLLLRLAYDPVASSAHYKVIMVPFLVSGFESQQEILIFSSENRDRGWVCHTPLRRINLDVVYFKHQTRPGAPILNGALYIPHVLYVMRYKLLERVQHKIKLPDNHDAHHHSLWQLPFLGILGGSICCAMLAEIANQFYLRIWTLVEESEKKRKRGAGGGASWALRHNVEMQFGAPIVLAFHPFSELVLLQTREQGIWGYDLNGRTRVGFGAGQLQSQIWLEHSNEAFPYTPCFYGCFDEGGESLKYGGSISSLWRRDQGQDIIGNSTNFPPSNLEPSNSNEETPAGESEGEL